MFNQNLIKLKIFKSTFATGFKTGHEKRKRTLNEPSPACIMLLFHTLHKLNHLNLKFQII
jgi:hypothetical protein